MWRAVSASGRVSLRRRDATLRSYEIQYARDATGREATNLDARTYDRRAGAILHRALRLGLSSELTCDVYGLSTRESFSRVKRTWPSSAALPSVPLWPCAGSTHYARRLRHRLCSACRERSSESRGNLAGSRMIEACGRHGEAVWRTHKMLHGRSRVHDSLYYLHSACYKTLQ